MDNNFRNILDLFLYAKEQNMCTSLFCATCGAMKFRNMCKEIGKDGIKRLIESVTDQDLEQMPDVIRYHGWYEPLRIILSEGYTADRYCPMMRWYNDGEEVHIASCKKKLILEMDNLKVYGIIGSIFINTECEVTALFQYNGASAAFLIDMVEFLMSFGIRPAHGILKESGFMPPNVKAIYYAETLQTTGYVEEAEQLIDEMLSLLSSKGYQSVAMNCVRTLGYSELDNLNIIKRWFERHPESPIHTVHLVDKRGGFNRLSTNV